MEVAQNVFLRIKVCNFVAGLVADMIFARSYFENFPQNRIKKVLEINSHNGAVISFQFLIIKARSNFAHLLFVRSTGPCISIVGNHFSH
jgi:hypothetical protein